MKGLGSKLARQYLKHLEHDVQRYDAWLRTLFCAMAEGPRYCRNAGAVGHTYDFGQWFYGEEGASLRNLTAYPKVARHYMPCRN